MAVRETEHHTPALPAAVADRLGFLLNKNAHLWVQRAEEILEGTGLTPKHFGCLNVIEHDGPLSQQELGRMIGVDRTTVVSIVDGLETAGFVERRRNPEDRRAYGLVITAKGRRWLERTSARYEEAERELLAPLSPAEQGTLRELLQRLLIG